MSPNTEKTVVELHAEFGFQPEEVVTVKTLGEESLQIGVVTAQIGEAVYLRSFDTAGDVITFTAHLARDILQTVPRRRGLQGVMIWFLEKRDQRVIATIVAEPTVYEEALRVLMKAHMAFGRSPGLSGPMKGLATEHIVTLLARGELTSCEEFFLCEILRQRGASEALEQVLMATGTTLVARGYAAGRLTELDPERGLRFFSLDQPPGVCMTVMNILKNNGKLALITDRELVAKVEAMGPFVLGWPQSDGARQEHQPAAR